MKEDNVEQISFGVVAVLTGHAHKIIINDLNGIQLVTGETTSKTQGTPPGFRLWHIKEPRPFAHCSIPLKTPGAGSDH